MRAAQRAAAAAAGQGGTEQPGSQAESNAAQFDPLEVPAWMQRERSLEAARLERENEAHLARLRQQRARAEALGAQGLSLADRPPQHTASVGSLLVGPRSSPLHDRVIEPPAELQRMARDLDDELRARLPTREEVEGRDYAPPSSRESRGIEHEQRERARLAEELRRAERRWSKWWTEVAQMDRISRPPLIAPRTWAMCRAVVYQPSACIAALRFIGACYGGAVLHRVSLAAFGGEGWAAQYDETDLCARRVVAASLCMLLQSQLLDYDRDRFGRLLYQPCMWGVGRGALCALLAKPHSEEPYSVEALQQAQPERGWFGLFHRLERAGVMVRHRPPVDAPCVRADEIGPSGYNTNRYWVAAPVNAKPALKSPSDRVALMHGVREFSDDHAAGFAVLDDGVFSLPRGRYLEAFGGVLLMLRYGVGKPPAPD